MLGLSLLITVAVAASMQLLEHNVPSLRDEGNTPRFPWYDYKYPRGEQSFHRPTYSSQPEREYERRPYSPVYNTETQPEREYESRPYSPVYNTETQPDRTYERNHNSPVYNTETQPERTYERNHNSPVYNTETQPERTYERNHNSPVYNTETQPEREYERRPYSPVYNTETQPEREYERRPYSPVYNTETQPEREYKMKPYPGYISEPQPERKYERQPGYYTSPVCSESTPCPDYSFLIIADGELGRDYPTKQEDEADFLKHFAEVGLSREDVISEGRRAAEFFLKAFGPDFTQMEDFRYLHLGGGLRNVAHFQPFITKRTSRLRVVSVSNRDEVQFFNRPLFEVGWILTFQNDQVSQGIFKGELPKDSFAVYVAYVFSPCDGESYGNCRNILQRDDPGKATLIWLASRGFSRTFEPGGFIPLDLVAMGSQHGRGAARGTVFNGKNGKADDLRIILNLDKSETKH